MNKRIKLITRIKAISEYNTSNKLDISYYEDNYSNKTEDELRVIIIAKKKYLYELLDNTILNAGIQLPILYDSTDGLNNLVKVSQLKLLAKQLNIPNYSKLKKQELINKIYRWYFQEKQKISNL
jgi:hypothetical protein